MCRFFLPFTATFIKKLKIPTRSLRSRQINMISIVNEIIDFEKYRAGNLKIPVNTVNEEFNSFLEDAIFKTNI